MLTSDKGDCVTPSLKHLLSVPLQESAQRTRSQSQPLGQSNFYESGRGGSKQRGNEEQKGSWSNKNQTKNIPEDNGVKEARKEGQSTQLYWVLTTALGGRAVSSHVLRTHLRNDEPAQQLLEKRGTWMLICQFPWCRHSQFNLPAVCQLTQKIPECPATGAC